MTFTELSRLITRTGWILIAMIVALIAVSAAIYLAHSRAQKNAATAASAAATVAPYQQHAATGAGEQISRQADRELSDTIQTQENHDAIVSAPGAKASVDAGVSDAGLRALCLRRATARDPACVRLRQAGPAALPPAR